MRKLLPSCSNLVECRSEQKKKNESAAYGSGSSVRSVIVDPIIVDPIIVP